MAKQPFDSVNYEIFKFDSGVARLRLALLKENFEYRTFYKRFIESIDDLNFSFPANHFEKFGLPGVRFTVGAPCYNDVLDLLNPLKESNLDSKKEDNILSKIFYFPSVMQVEFNTPYIEGIASRTFESIERKKTKPHERIFIADLRKKKKQILREFNEFIDATYNQTDLKPDTSRFRAEAWNHLKIWKLRRKKLSFSRIALELKLTEDNAKKSFYRAYELTQGRKYDPEMLKREVWIIRKTELKKTCDNCPDSETCVILCPEILRYVDQDTLTHSKEKLF